STGLAAAATAAGMLAFTVSGIPLVRQFGLFMALGVAMAYLANYLVGLPLLLLLGRTVPSVLNATSVRAAAGRRIAAIGSRRPAGRRRVRGRSQGGGEPAPVPGRLQPGDAAGCQPNRADLRPDPELLHRRGV